MKGGTDDATVERLMKGLMSSQKFAKELAEAKGDRKALAAKFREAVEGHQRITQGRNALEMSPQEYLKELLEARPDTVDGVDIWTSKNVVIADLVVGTLLKQVRDLGTAGREIADLVDLQDIDGPTKQLVDTMLTALYETKKARFVKSDSFRELGLGKKSKKTVEEATKQSMEDAKDSIMSLLKIAGDEKDDNMLSLIHI